MSDDTPAARPAHQAGATTAREHPVTFGEIFAVREYRAVYLALVVNWVGEYLARAAITVLVFQQTGSVLLSAASFAISYLPWIVGGPVLAALAERYPYRRVMVSCDLLRMALLSLLILPGLPVTIILLVLFVSMLAAPPTQAARSAMLPLLLDRDRLVVALAANATTGQAAQVIGYLAGATLATAVDPRLAMGVVAVTFALSATFIATGVRARPAARAAAARDHLLRETAEGFRLVFGNPVLQAITVLVVSVSIFAVVPEGLAAGWAAQLDTDPATRGVAQGMIMAAGPVGWVIGGVLLNRFVLPATRQRLIRPLAVLSVVTLVPALLSPPAPLVALLTMLSGVAQGGLMPTLNGLFVLALPHGYRARAFAVVQGLLQLAQGGAVLIAGTIGEHIRVPVVVGLWSVGGTMLMILLAMRFPGPDAFDRAIDAAAATVPADERPPGRVYQPRHAAPDFNGMPQASRPRTNGSRPLNGSGTADQAPRLPRATRITHDHG